MTPEKMPELPEANGWLVHGQYDGRPDLGPQVFYYYGGAGKTHVEAHALHGDKCEPVYTATQLRAYGELCRQGEAEDAARYRWLRDSVSEDAFIACWFNGDREDIRQMTGGIADAAIDTARTKEARDEG